MLNVLVGVPISRRFIARLRESDERLVIQMAPPALRRFLGNELPEDIGGWFLAGEQRLSVDDGPLDSQIARLLEPAEVLIALPRFSEDVLSRAPNLRWIQFLSAGVERFDAGRYTEIAITNGSGAAGISISEHVIGMMLLFARGFPQLLERQRQKVWDRGWVARELHTATCGIVGLGAIGTEVARRARALGMRVLAVRRSGPGEGEQHADEVLPPAGLPYLLRESDYVVLAAPLTAETRKLIGAEQLGTMKRSAVLINVGRGGLIDDEALIEALGEGTIAGAALDVLQQEPLPESSPLWTLPNVIITPHSSVRTDRHFDRVADLVCDNLRRYLAGEPLRNRVDGERGY